MKRREATILPTGRIRLREALERLVQFYDATGKKDEAAVRRKELARIAHRGFVKRAFHSS
jgi:hypothetical protein